MCSMTEATGHIEGLDKAPVVYVIAGPNGAGKTTFALSYLPKIAGVFEYVNADEIAKGLSPLNVNAAQMAAGRLFHDKIETYIRERKSFAFETTLAAKTHMLRVAKLRQEGWQVFLFYLYLPSAEFSHDRVQMRVEQGGHDVPYEAIVRRYPRSIRALFEFMPKCDGTFCFDGSLSTVQAIFKYDHNVLTIYDQDKYNRIRSFLDYDGN